VLGFEPEAPFIKPVDLVDGIAEEEPPVPDRYPSLIRRDELAVEARQAFHVVPMIHVKRSSRSAPLRVSPGAVPINDPAFERRPDRLITGAFDEMLGGNERSEGRLPTGPEKPWASLSFIATL
jgi:hypothetical protein